MKSGSPAVLSHFTVNENPLNKQVQIRQSPTLIAYVCPPSVLTRGVNGGIIVSCRYVGAVLSILTAATSAATSCSSLKQVLTK